MSVFGCIADDFTGASDAEDMQAVVTALKSRTHETASAVADSVRAAKFLLFSGGKQIYFKYCSTFDSTPKGNIGPVADALMELLCVPYTVLCPALPVNGRIVENGNLYVNGVPLHERHMRSHPLTPMWDCSVAELMKPQSQYPCRNIGTVEPDRSASDKRADGSSGDAKSY